ncbi:MAG: DUF4838 domain-containing protein [Armatimonadota bacterium]|jgi:hypothetical protein
MDRVIISCILIIASTLPSVAEMRLAVGGATDYAVVVDPQATVTEKHAAAELSSFLGRVTGARFEVIEADAALDMPCLYVGPGRASREIAPGLPWDDLSPDGIVIETVGESLVLGGDRPRGTLYAVYTFLEDAVGCRWWAPDASFIPDAPDLTVPEQSVLHIPPLEYREVFWWDAFDGDWAARIKSNGHRPSLEEKHGGKVSYAGFFVHTFRQLVPDEHFAEHPEWFSERSGTRIGGEGVRSQLCLTNPEVLNLIEARVRQRLEDHPDAGIVSVSQNDWDNHCLCAECLALEEQDGSAAGPLLRFVNDVAERIGPDYPGVAVDTLAYQYTRRPPENVTPLPNVIVRLCSIECSFLQPLSSAANASFGDDIRGWDEICDRLYVWDYTTNFGHYILPHPNLRVLAPNIRFFVEHGVKGVFEQGAYQSPGGEFALLRAWMLGRLLWDPSQDTDALIDEFVYGYYEAAGPFIREYITTLHDEAEATDHYMRIGGNLNAPWLTLDLMGRAEELFERAEAAVSDDPEVLGRVRLARLPIRYVWAMRWHEFEAEARRQGIEWPGPADFAMNAEEFIEVAEANEITRISERNTLDVFKARTVDLGRTEAAPPSETEGLDRRRWIDLQDGAFRLAREGTWARLEHDERASDSVAARMPGDHNEWAVQQDIPAGAVEEGAAYRVYVVVRVEATAEEGPAFSAGVYDVANRRSVGAVRVTLNEILDDGYHTYEVASAPLHGQMYIYVAPPGRPGEVQAVWVDRIWLVRDAH